MTTARNEGAWTPAWTGDSVWKQALGQALDGPAKSDVFAVFLEDRQDLSIALDAGAEGPSIEPGRTAGVAVETRDGRLRFRADPRVATLLELARGGGQGDEAVRGSAEGAEAAPEVRLAAGPAIGLVTALAEATSKLQPRALIRARWVGFEQRVHVGRVERGVVADRRRSRRLHLQADLERGGRAARAVAEAVLRSDAPEALASVVNHLAEEVAARVEARLGAERPPSGERPIVFAPGVGGILLHEVVGHALEADTVLGGASWLAGSAAEPFRGSSRLMVVDDPRRGRAAWRHDDDGEPAKATALMREGRVAGWLHDRATAHASGRPATGHGRRASFRDARRPRMGCTFLAAGRDAPAEALHGIDDGIYVRRMEAASTDTRSGRATFRVTDADRIRNGRLTSPLAPHVLRVEGHEALSNIDCVADDLAFDVCIGSCLHHGQPLSVSVGAPTFRTGLTSVVF